MSERHAGGLAQGAHAPMVGRGGIVPYVTRWSAEDILSTTVVRRGRWGVGYADELPTDRDGLGVLWTRATSRPGRGRPVYKTMHPLRQRRAMRRLLCQVCGEPADYTKQGHLWLLIDQEPTRADWPERAINPFPPVCSGCAMRSVRLCPPLRRGFTAFRAHSTVHGVIGVQYVPGPHYPLVGLAEDDGGRPVAHGDPMIWWYQATQLTRRMHDCVLVDLDGWAP